MYGQGAIITLMLCLMYSLIISVMAACLFPGCLLHGCIISANWLPATWLLATCYLNPGCLLTGCYRLEWKGDLWSSTEKSPVSQGMCPKWHAIPDVVHYFWAEPYGPWSKLVPYIVNRLPFRTEPRRCEVLKFSRHISYQYLEVALLPLCLSLHVPPSE